MADKGLKSCHVFYVTFFSYLTDLAVFARVALRAGAEILVWLCIQTSASVHTGLVCATVIQIYTQTHTVKFIRS